LDDPRHSAWRRVLVERVFNATQRLEHPLDEPTSALAQQMNVVFARHEIVSDFTAQSLAWMEGGITERAKVITAPDDPTSDMFGGTCEGQVYSRFAKVLYGQLHNNTCYRAKTKTTGPCYEEDNKDYDLPQIDG
jgi:hypothetical protein